MLFKRRTDLPLLRRLSHLLWPRSGWSRTARYLTHRVSRISDSPHAIAAGLACGAAVSFTPFLGFHFVLAALLAWLMGGNYLASAVGTVVGNPWTFPIIWLSIYQLGTWMLGLEGTVFHEHQMTFQSIFDNPFELLLPMAFGGLPTAVVAWFAVYWPTRRVVAAYQAARRARLAKEPAEKGEAGKFGNRENRKDPK